MTFDETEAYNKTDSVEVIYYKGVVQKLHKELANAGQGLIDLAKASSEQLAKERELRKELVGALESMQYLCRDSESEELIKRAKEL